jgi:hypothetical protein
VSPLTSRETDRSVYISHNASQVMIGSSSEAAFRFTRDIVKREKSDKHTLRIENWQTSDTVISHHLHSMLQVILDATRDNLLRHGALHPDFSERPALCVCCHADVAVGQNANRPGISIHHRHATTDILPHDLRSRVEAIVRMAGPHLISHELLNFHRTFTF